MASSSKYTGRDATIYAEGFIEGVARAEASGKREAASQATTAAIASTIAAATAITNTEYAAQQAELDRQAGITPKGVIGVKMTSPNVQTFGVQVPAGDVPPRPNMSSAQVLSALAAADNK